MTVQFNGIEFTDVRDYDINEAEVTIFFNDDVSFSEEELDSKLQKLSVYGYNYYYKHEYERTAALVALGVDGIKNLTIKHI